MKRIPTQEEVDHINHTIRRGDAHMLALRKIGLPLKRIAAMYTLHYSSVTARLTNYRRSLKKK